MNLTRTFHSKQCALTLTQINRGFSCETQPGAPWGTSQGALQSFPFHAGLDAREKQRKALSSPLQGVHILAGDSDCKQVIMAHMIDTEIDICYIMLPKTGMSDYRACGFGEDEQVQTVQGMWGQSPPRKASAHLTDKTCKGIIQSLNTPWQVLFPVPICCWYFHRTKSFLPATKNGQNISSGTMRIGPKACFKSILMTSVQNQTQPSHPQQKKEKEPFPFQSFLII